MDLADHFARVLEFAAHRRLRLSGDLRGIRHALLQGLGHGFEALGNGLTELAELLRETLRVTGESLQVALQLLHARAGINIVAPPLRTLPEKPKKQRGRDEDQPDDECVHGLRQARTGNNPSTVLGSTAL